MSLITLLISILFLAMILGGILLLKRSAKKFILTDQQLKKIKARNEQLAQEELNDDK